MKKSEAVFILMKFISPAYNERDKLLKLLDRVKDEWEVLISLSNRYLLVPVLYLSLKEKNLYDKLEDKMLQEYLYEIYRLNKERNEGIVLQLEEICDILSSIKITPLLLKGSAALSEGYFGDNAKRSMVDIDILVPASKIFKAIDILKEFGYKEIDPTAKLGKGWHHYRRLYRAERTTSLEVHRKITNYRALKYMSDFKWKLHTKDSSLIKDAKVLEPTYEFFYTFLHSEIAHDYHELIISLRHLHHGAVLLHRYRDEIDFKRVEEYIEKYNLHKIWYEYLWILKRFFLVKIPFETPAMQTYERQVCKNIDSEGGYLWAVKMFLRRFRHAFRFDTLQQRYKNLRYRYQLLYYIPIRFIHLSFKKTSDKLITTLNT